MMPANERSPLAPILHWTLMALGTLFFMAIGAGGHMLWDHESRTARLEQRTQALQHYEDEVRSALKVVERQQQELVAVSSTIARVETHLKTTSDLLSKQIDLATDDRFRRKEWDSERKALEQKIDVISKQVLNLSVTIQSISEKMP